MGHWDLNANKLVGTTFNNDGSNAGHFDIASGATNDDLAGDYGDHYWHGKMEITASDSGGFLVTWGEDDVVRGGVGNDIFGQHFDQDGQKLGSAFQINQLHDEHQHQPSVVKVDGGYFVAFTSGKLGPTGILSEDSPYHDMGGAGKFPELIW